MPDALFYTVVLLLALIGLAAVIRWCCLRFLLPKKGLPAYILVPIDSGNAEGRLRMTAEVCRRSESPVCKGILAVDMGLNSEERSICQKLCSEYETITLCDLDDLEDFIFQEHILSRDE